MRPARVLLVGIVFLAGCADAADARETMLVATIARADEPLLRQREALVAGKYRRMASSLFDFYRGTFPLFLRDLSETTTAASTTAFDLDAPLALAIGDAHPENFGTLRASDGTFALEPNDFDAADRWPYAWDLRRLTVGMALAARVSNADDEAARALAVDAQRDIVRATADGYFRAIHALAEGGATERVESGGGVPNLDDLFSRSERDLAAHRDFTELTELDSATGARRLRRGVLDPADPENVYLDAPTFARAAIERLLLEYAQTLVVHPAPDELRVLDVVRELGSGVASWARIRFVVLVRGPSDDPGDDVLLEVKELGDSGSRGTLPPGAYWDDVAARVRGCSRAAWARPDADPLWATGELFGLPVQVRTETAAHKTLRTSRMVGDRGTPEALAATGAALGALLARVHASGDGGRDTATAIAARVGDDGDAFAASESDTAIAYADLVESDWPRFQRALERLGPRLGLPRDPTDTPTAEQRALFGTPPEVP